MKKIILAVCLFVSTAASATDLTGGNNAVLMTDCNMIANDIVLVMSSNALGAFDCNEANKIFAISACHTAGSSIGRSAVVLDPNNTPADTTDDCVVTATEKCVQTVTGAAFPTASTVNGTVGNRYPGATCSNADSQTLADAATTI